MSNRQERRRRRKEGGAPKPDVILVGDGFVARGLDQTYQPRPGVKMPAKVIGKHRFVATAAWTIDSAEAARAYDPTEQKLLDGENMVYMTIGCWDCERPLEIIGVDSICPAAGDDG